MVQTNAADPPDPRVTVRRDGPPRPGGQVVVCWLQRAPRAEDNPALDLAIRAGNDLGLPVVALFVLRDGWPCATHRAYHFLVQGLIELPSALASRRVGFVLRQGGEDEVARFCEEVRAAMLVGDENPLRDPERWRQHVAAGLRVPFHTVEADVIVPSALMGKEQFSAGTMRPRLHRHLAWWRATGREEAAVHAPPGGQSPAGLAQGLAVLDGVAMDRRVGPAPGWTGGSHAARTALTRFVRHRLSGYAVRRNRPEADGTSRLSPYLHFGQIGPREVARAIDRSGAPLVDRHAFLEQFIVRRELAWNFVRFNPRYDSLAGCERWALRSLDAHREDEREHRYDLALLEQAATHDPLWNAAQRQMVQSGWMHGYV
ncbi:MAG TPA: deoxyribodipyrimidine photo-lyase, partial [Vicinamibacterales bacterium]|nr:deoxyribodipyrimidine photo-lyase [Vicinamibacterales bacterium]